MSAPVGSTAWYAQAAKQLNEFITWSIRKRYKIDPKDSVIEILHQMYAKFSQSYIVNVSTDYIMMDYGSLVKYKRELILQFHSYSGRDSTDSFMGIKIYSSEDMPPNRIYMVTGCNKKLVNSLKNNLHGLN